MRKLIYLVFGVCMFSVGQAQNQFHVSQFMLHRPLVNPAAVGAYETMNGALLYRTQWVGFDGAPKVAGFNFNSPIGEKGKSNIGLTLINDKIGVNSTTDISGSYAYYISPSSDSKLTFGLSATLRMAQSDFLEVETNGIVDPSFQANSPTLMMPNFKFGTYYSKEKFYVGFAIPNLLHNEIVNLGEFKGQTDFDFNQMHMYLHGGYEFKLDENIDLKSAVLFKQVSGAPLQMDLSALFEYNQKFGAGVAYRTSGELAALVQIQVTEMFKLGYAYDFTLNNLGNYSSGSHEIMIVFEMKSEKSAARFL